MRESSGIVAGAEPGGDATEKGMEHGVRLLVVDDDQVDRIAFRRMLSRAGVRADVSDAGGVLEAIELLTASRFACVFLDYNLPDGDGLTFLRGVRAAGISTPVVILTGETNQELAADLLVSGAADFISKNDLTAERLLASLAKVCRTG